MKQWRCAAWIASGLLAALPPPAVPQPASGPASAAPTAPAGSAAAGNSLKNFIENNPFVTVLSLLVAGFGVGAGVSEYFKPWRLDRGYQDLKERLAAAESKAAAATASGAAAAAGVGTAAAAAPLVGSRLPIRIAVMGALTGPDAAFGLSQLRGVVSAVMHATVEDFGRPLEDWEQFFRITAINTELKGAGAQRGERLAAAFREAQAQADVVFGPEGSQNVVEVLITRKESVNVPTLITVAATPRIREHAAFGHLLLQLSPNIDSYARQYCKFIDRFLAPKPSRLVVLAKDDEYGRSSRLALTKYASEDHVVEMHAVTYPACPSGMQADCRAAAKQIVAGAAFAEALDGAGSDVFVMIADTNPMLRELVIELKERHPHVRLGTLSSPDIQDLQKDAFQGMYLIYSFAPVQFSLNTLAFYRYSSAAKPYVEQLVDPNLPIGPWPRISSVDAEVHDAGIHWVRHFVRIDKQLVPHRTDRNLFVTSFALGGYGKSMANDGALFLFRVERGRIVPVEIAV